VNFLYEGALLDCREHLYTYQKNVNQQVMILANLLQAIDAKKAALLQLKKQLANLKSDPLF